MIQLALVSALAFGVGYAVPVVADVVTPAVVVEAQPLATPDPPAELTPGIVPTGGPVVAAPVTIPPGDPVDDPAAWYASIRDALATHRLLASLVGLCALLRVLSTRVPWLRRGWRVPAVGALGALLTSLIETWPGSLAGWVAWVLPAALGVALMLFRPTPTPPAPDPTT